MKKKEIRWDENNNLKKMNIDINLSISLIIYTFYLQYLIILS